MRDWKKYERYISALLSEEYTSPNVTVLPNAKLEGLISGVPRQVDVLVDRRFEGGKFRRIIVDAKRYKRAINVKDVESFEGMMRDCGASKGILVCPNGYSTAAKRRAQRFIDIRLVSLDELESLDLDSWGECVSSGCDGRKSRGLVLWDSPFEIGSPYIRLNVVCTGKCDECSDFHVWCWACGQQFALRNEDEYKCGCTVPWFWLTAIEEDEGVDGELAKYVYLLVPTLTDVFVADRKPLS